MSRVFDDRFTKGDVRYKVATLHQHLTSTGAAGRSGRYDPKRIMDSDTGIIYEKIEDPTEACDLCVSGDMISPWRRFLYSKYRPGHRFWHEPWRWVRILWGRIQGIIAFALDRAEG
jgi:hypothetical protein